MLNLVVYEVTTMLQKFGKYPTRYWPKSGH